MHGEVSSKIGCFKYMIKIKLIVVFCLIFSFMLFPKEKISQHQDENNSSYLQQLDANINGTLQILTAFNTAANKMPDLVTGLDIYSKFLMELTLECSNLKNSIAVSAEMTAEEREILIQDLIASLNPSVKFLPFFIDDKKDEQNRELMQIMHKRVIEHVVDLQKKILQEEKGIIESKTFNKYFFNLHSQHFLYQLLLDFMEPADKLSRDNRDYLLKMTRELEDMMLEENDIKEK